MVARFEKFANLRKHLEKQKAELKGSGRKTITIPFGDIESCLGFPLPPSAYTHRAWWANTPGKVWERVGFRAKDVDLTGHYVTFEGKWPFSPEERAGRVNRPLAEGDSARSSAPVVAQGKSILDRMKAESASLSTQGVADAAGSYLARESASKEPGRCRHPLYGALKGHIRLVGGTDLTGPADPNWGEHAWGGDKK